MRLARLDTSYPSYRPDGRRKADVQQRMGWAVFLTIVLGAALLIVTAVVDGQGRKGYHHTTPLPPKVIQLDDSRYVVLDKAVDASAICTGPTSSDTDRIEQTRELDTVKIGTNGETAAATYVVCGHEQYWNDHRAPSVNLLHAGQKVLLSPFTIIGGGIFLLVLWSFPIRYLIAWDLWEKQRTREAQAAQEKKEADENRLRELAAAEQQIKFDRLRSELVNEWSRADSPMSDQDFESKLADLDSKRDRGEL